MFDSSTAMAFFAISSQSMPHSLIVVFDSVIVSIVVNSRPLTLVIVVVVESYIIAQCRGVNVLWRWFEVGDALGDEEAGND